MGLTIHVLMFLLPSAPFQVSVLAVRAALWRHQYPHNSASKQSLDLTRLSGTGVKAGAEDTSEDAHSMRMTSAQVEEVTKKLKKSLMAKMGADQSTCKTGEEVLLLLAGTLVVGWRGLLEPYPCLLSIM
jgi:hypothetical protein